MSKFQDSEELQIRESNDESGQRFFKFRVAIDIAKPLCRTVKLVDPTYGNIIGILRYERLPFLCFKCGIIVHTLRQCGVGGDAVSTEEKNSLQFGTWLYGEMGGGNF